MTASTEHSEHSQLAIAVESPPGCQTSFFAEFSSSLCSAILYRAALTEGVCDTNVFQVVLTRYPSPSFCCYFFFLEFEWLLSGWWVQMVVSMTIVQWLPWWSIPMAVWFWNLARAAFETTEKNEKNKSITNQSSVFFFTTGQLVWIAPLSFDTAVCLQLYFTKPSLCIKY